MSRLGHHLLPHLKYISTVVIVIQRARTFCFWDFSVVVSSCVLLPVRGSFLSMFHGPFLFVGTSRLWVLPVHGPFSVGSSNLCYFLFMGPSTLLVFPICEYFLYMALPLCQYFLSMTLSCLWVLPAHGLSCLGMSCPWPFLSW